MKNAKIDLIIEGLRRVNEGDGTEPCVDCKCAELQPYENTLDEYLKGLRYTKTYSNNGEYNTLKYVVASPYQDLPYEIMITADGYSIKDQSEVFGIQQFETLKGYMDSVLKKS